MKTLHEMLIRMFKMAVWDNQGRQYLPVFNFDWKHVLHYAPAEDASGQNTTRWIYSHNNTAYEAESDI